MKIITYDGIEVKVGDRVWVHGSDGINETTVKEPVTSYNIFGNPVPVKYSFSTKESLERYIKDN
jgi:hypothetical protein